MSMEYQPFASKSSSSSSLSTGTSAHLQQRNGHSVGDIMPVLRAYSRSYVHGLDTALASFRAYGNLPLKIFILEYIISNFFIPLLLYESSEARRSIYYFIFNCIGIQAIYAFTGFSKALMLTFLTSSLQLMSIIKTSWKVFQVEHYSAYFLPRMTFPNLFLHWHHYSIIEHTVILCAIGYSLLRHTGFSISEDKSQFILALPTDMTNARKFSIIVTSTEIPKSQVGGERQEAIGETGHPGESSQTKSPTTSTDTQISSFEPKEKSLKEEPVESRSNEHCYSREPKEMFKEQPKGFAKEFSKEETPLGQSKRSSNSGQQQSK